MNISLSAQLLISLVLYASCTHAIMVKFGTKGGPIEPPTPEPLPVPQPLRVPAPVWEQRSDDVPDPNAQWRPQQMFFPQPRYTQVVYNSRKPIPVESNAQRFVNSYITNRPPSAGYEDFNPTKILGTQNLPGIGIRYFAPAYVNEIKVRKQEKIQDETRHNDIETNKVGESQRDSEADVMWKFQKDSATRLLRQTLEANPRQVYQWPVYVQPRH